MNGTKYLVRRAKASDDPWLLEAMRDFETEADFVRSVMSASDDVTRARIRWVEENHLFLVAQLTTTGENVGFCAGVVMPHIFNPELKSFHELLWWVQPRHRGSSAAAMLLLEAVAWARESGAGWIWWSLANCTRIKGSSLAKLGFEFREAHYLLEV